MRSAVVERGIRDFILNQLPVGAEFGELPLEDSWFGAAALDSAAMIEIVAFCEQRFTVEIPDTELAPANFASVRAIAAMVIRTRAAQRNRFLRRLRKIFSRRRRAAISHPSS